jgi:hypothetical protein
MGILIRVGGDPSPTRTTHTWTNFVLVAAIGTGIGVLLVATLMAVTVRRTAQSSARAGASRAPSNQRPVPAPQSSPGSLPSFQSVGTTPARPGSSPPTGGIPGNWAGRSDRPSPADALALVAQVSNVCWIDGQWVGPARFDESVLHRLVSSPDSLVRKAAKTALDLQGIRALVPRIGGSPSPEQQSQLTARWRELLRSQFQRALASEEGGLQGTASDIEKFVGQETMHAAEFTGAMEFLEAAAELHLRQDVRELASTSLARSGRLSLQVALERERPGLVTVRSPGATLHHCVLITYLRTDVRQVAQAASQELGFGRLLGGVFSEEFARSSMSIAEWRYRKDMLDPGQLVYVPVVPAGSTLTAAFGSLTRYEWSTSADISLWSDEGSVAQLQPSNWQEVKLAVEQRTLGRGRATGPRGGHLTRPSIAPGGASGPRIDPNRPRYRPGVAPVSRSFGVPTAPSRWPAQGDRPFTGASGGTARNYPERRALRPSVEEPGRGGYPGRGFRSGRFGSPQQGSGGPSPAPPGGAGDDGGGRGEVPPPSFGLLERR